MSTASSPSAPIDSKLEFGYRQCPKEPDRFSYGRIYRNSVRFHSPQQNDTSVGMASAPFEPASAEAETSVVKPRAPEAK